MCDFFKKWLTKAPTPTTPTNVEYDGEKYMDDNGLNSGEVTLMNAIINTALENDRIAIEDLDQLMENFDILRPLFMLLSQQMTRQIQRINILESAVESKEKRIRSLEIDNESMSIFIIKQNEKNEEFKNLLQQLNP